MVLAAAALERYAPVRARLDLHFRLISFGSAPVAQLRD
jgi:hypothetical protein